MTQKNNTLPIVPTLFHFLGLMALVVFLFIGLNYLLRGNLILSGFLSLLAFVVILLSVQYARVLKQRKSRDQTRALELVLLAFFSIATLSAFPFLFHFVYIDFISKDAIKQAGKDKLEELNEIQTRYDDALSDSIAQFDNLAHTKMNTYFLSSSRNKPNIQRWFEEELGEGTINFRSSESRIRNDLKENLEMHTERIYLNYNIQRTRDEVDQYYQQTFPVFDDWKFLKISHYYYDIDRVKAKLIQAVMAKMPHWDDNEKEKKEIQLGEVSSSMSNAGAKIWLLNIGVFLALSFLLLLPYLATKRPINPLKDRNSKNYQGGIKI